MSDKEKSQTETTEVKKHETPTVMTVEKLDALNKRLDFLEGRLEALDHYNQRQRLAPPSPKGRRGRIGV